MQLFLIVASTVKPDLISKKIFQVFLFYISYTLSDINLIIIYKSSPTTSSSDEFHTFKIYIETSYLIS